MRWVDSVVMICSRCVRPFAVCVLLSCSACLILGLTIVLGEVMLPQPSMKPRLMSSHL
jgi:hypothetical protein